MPAPGTIISERYTIVRQIGEGGMGSVYEARHVHIGRKVAIKFLHRSEDSESTQENLFRFLQEARIAGTLRHRNICEVTDYGTTEDGESFLVMEFLEGYSLAEAIALEKQLSPIYSLKLMGQVLEGLQEAHSKNIIHRDLKPANIFITNEKGYGELVKVLDFGISKIKQPGHDSMKLTKSGVLIGTPYYMAPEQLQGEKAVDPRCDVYACGVILYEMITGKLPFTGKTYSEIVVKVITEPIPDPAVVVPSLDQRISRLLMRCMAKDQAARPENAARLREEIEAIVYGTTTGLTEPMIRTKTEAVVVRKEGRAFNSKSIIIFSIIAVVVLAGIVMGIVSLKSYTNDGTKAAVEQVSAGAGKGITESIQPTT